MTLPDDGADDNDVDGDVPKGPIIVVSSEEDDEKTDMTSTKILNTPKGNGIENNVVAAKNKSEDKSSDHNFDSLNVEKLQGTPSSRNLSGNNLTPTLGIFKKQGTPQNHGNIFYTSSSQTSSDSGASITSERKSQKSVSFSKDTLHNPYAEDTTAPAQVKVEVRMQLDLKTIYGRRISTKDGVKINPLFVDEEEDLDQANNSQSVPEGESMTISNGRVSVSPGVTV